MTQTTLKVKNGTITLPDETRRAWKEADVFVRISQDTVVLKKVQPSSFWDTWQKMKSVAQDITKKDIDKAVSWARRKKSAG